MWRIPMISQVSSETWSTKTKSEARRTGRISGNGDRQHNLLTSLILLLFGTSVLVKIGGDLLIRKRLRDMGVGMSSDYSYIGHDHPESWSIQRGDVLMAFSNPKHYELETPQGALEWSSLVPSSSSSPNGIIHLGPYHQPYSISMLHQLKCLDIIRNETVRERVAGDSEGKEERMLARHCLNYLRQMVTCRADLELESFQFASHKNPIDLHGVYECKDWSRVYEEVKWNQEEHEKWLQKHR